MVVASAPGKLMLYGEHAVVYGYPCIVTSVDQRVYVSVERNGVEVLHLEAPDLGLMAYSKTIADLGQKDVPKSVAFVEMLYKRFLEKYPQNHGIIVKTKSDFSSNFGFGSSSAVTVAFAKALTTTYDLRLTNQELFDLCYRAVLDVQGVGSGFDLASAIWGKTIYYQTPAKVVREIDLNGVELVVGYTGIKADTPTIVRMVAEKRRQCEDEVNGIFNKIEKVVNEAEVLIKNQNMLGLGEITDLNQDLLKKLEVSCPELENLCEAAKRAGAYGAKLSGAGGGDCMLAICSVENREKIEAEMVKVGGQVMRVNLNAEGVKLEA